MFILIILLSKMNNNNCFYWDYDLANSLEKIEKCPVCGSERISLENIVRVS